MINARFKKEINEFGAGLQGLGDKCLALKNSTFTPINKYCRCFKTFLACLLSQHNVAPINFCTHSLLASNLCVYTIQ